MESLGATLSFPSCLVILLLLLCIGATKECEFPAIFNLGDSNSDTGGLAASLVPLNPPYGDTYFHRPAGRATDGRLIIDFIAQSFGLPYLSAYLDSLGANFTHGANFATSASTITPPTNIIPQGGVFGNLMPKEKYFSEALYTFDIGQNDLAEGFFDNKTVEQVNASVPNITVAFSTNVKNIYKLGGRSFWIHNTGPLGCLPYMLASFLSVERDEFGCAKPLNEVAQYFNLKLKEAIVQLRKDLPLAAITYVDIYSVKFSLITNAKKYGFEKPFVACCGYGSGEYNYGIAECGGTAIVNGSEIFGGSCENPSVRVNWDGIHFTEAANKFIFDIISSGAFSDPPLPLNMACHTNSNKIQK
ncbi:esterase-like [Senna tora]|uniref:Esterase-like n=1 Tax=Senna tora TaxID=362788 RepID=A0A834T9R1_9FABA|nr:esterase-like [Senna tora]